MSRLVRLGTTAINVMHVVAYRKRIRFIASGACICIVECKAEVIGCSHWGYFVYAELSRGLRARGAATHRRRFVSNIDQIRLGFFDS